MLTKDEVQNIKELFKSGSTDNIELAIILAESNGVDLYLGSFTELWEFIQKHKYRGWGGNVSSYKPTQVGQIRDILNQKELKLELKEETIIPASICFLARLQKLTIIAEKPVWIPHTLGYLEQLEELEMSLLDQDKLPHCIFDLIGLKKLDLSMNLFEELHRDVWKLRQLEVLNLSLCYHLHTIPKELYGLPKLRELYLIHTKIDEISPAIAYSTLELFAVDIKHAKSVFADPQFGRKMLRRLNGENKFSQTQKGWLRSGHFSKIEDPPSSIIDQGAEAIKEYFLNR